MVDTDSKWLRKATLVERYFEIGHQHQVYLTHYTLDLASVRPLDEAFLRKAFEHLYRKVPVLRVCLRERDSELWVREMDGCNIDLEIIEGGDIETEKDKVTVHIYDTKEGPLWCVRVLPLNKTYSPSSSSIQQQKEEEDHFTFSYSLIFGIHHALSDGFTNIKICNLLCAIMDDLMAGYTINDEQQLGEYTGEEEIYSLYDKEMVKLKKDPELCNRIKEELDAGTKVRPLIRHICQIPSETMIMTRNVSVVFDKTTSEMFYRKAKSEGVTLHTALTGLINLALTKLMQESGISQEVYNIRAGHDINLRKYYVGDTSRVLGAHIPIFGYRSPFQAPADMLPVFWDTVKAFHKTFQSDISKGMLLSTVAYRLMTEDLNYNFKELFRADGEPTYYYTLSNMGNLRGMLSEEGKFVSVQKLTRFSSLRNRGSFMGIYAHTFRGQLNISLSYSTRFLTYDFVHRLKELLQIHMTSVCEI